MASGNGTHAYTIVVVAKKGNSLPLTTSVTLPCNACYNILEELLEISFQRDIAGS